MKVCIVGGTGNISSAIVSLLLEKGHEVHPVQSWQAPRSARRGPPDPGGPEPAGGVRKKESYRSEAEALRRAGIARKEQGVRLRVYPCKFGYGWHLTRADRG